MRQDVDISGGPRQLQANPPIISYRDPAGARGAGWCYEPKETDDLLHAIAKGGWWVTDNQAADESPTAAVRSESVSEEPDQAEVGTKDDQDEDPDILLGRWLSQIRDAERRAEREAAAIRLR